MFIVFAVIVAVMLIVLAVAVITKRFELKEGLGCVTAIAFVLLAFFFVIYLITAHPGWYRFW